MSVYLIDFENVRSPGLDGIERLGEKDTVYVFYTQNAPAVRFETVSLILKSKAKINYMYVEAGGKNALDFQLSGFLGYLAAVSEDKEFYIISADGGFSHVKNFLTKQIMPDGLIIKIFGKISVCLALKDKKSNVPKENAVPEETAPESSDETGTERETAESSEITVSAEDTEETEETEETVETAEADNSSENEKKARGIIKEVLSPSGNIGTDECSDVQIIIKTTTNKQEFYTRMMSAFGRKKGLAFYKAVRSEYSNLKDMLSAT